MAEPGNIKKMEEKVLLLETQVKHLENDLRLTKEENETSLANYFEIYSHMERKVEERTQDIKKYQKALEQKSKELEMMLDASPAMIFYKDVEQRFIRVNKKFAKTIGIRINEIIGKKHNELFPKNKDHSLKKDLEVITTGKPLFNKKEFLETQKGRRQILIDRRPYKDINRKVVGLIGFALDITDIERAEKEKKKLEKQLQQTQKMEAIGTLAGGIAHNFNNLLMGILGNASLMLLNASHNHPYYKKLKTIEKLVKSGSELTNQLLGYAREGKYEVKPFSLNQLVKETSESFRITKKEIVVHHELADDLFGIRADQGQIEQVLLNLYLNAADAMPRGGELYIRTMNLTHEDMGGKPYKPKPGNYVLLTVRDTGTGMDKKTKERIFEPFFTTKGLAKGTGLGLASAYGIIKAHGGYIDVDTLVEHGTTFSIYLSATEEEIKKEKELPVEICKGKETILLVDDEDIIIDLGEQALKTMGYDVLLARSGKEALELYKENHEEIDMILLDMIMPDMDGGETYDRMKQINPNLKVLLSSGYSIEGQATEILERGCDGFIQKPFNLQELSQKLRETLDNKMILNPSFNKRDDVHILSSSMVGEN